MTLRKNLTENKLDKERVTNEPSQLQRGKAFHRLIQDEWRREAQGDICAERHIIKPNGRKGRVDVFVNDDEST